MHNLGLVGGVKNILIVGFSGILLLLMSVDCALAQEDESKVVQFSGVVTTQDTVSGIMGAHIYVPKRGRGTTTNYYGYFSFPVLEGDSLVISVVGFHKKYVVIPEVEGDSYTQIISMQEDTTYLPELEISPFPTEEMFKEAVLAYRLPNQGDMNNMDSNLDAMTLAEMARAMPMDGSMNHRYFMQQQAAYLFDANGPRYNPLLNPFAWSEFIKSLKKKKK